MKILLTGATGFVGIPLLRHIKTNTCHTPIAVARHPVINEEHIDFVTIDNISHDTDWSCHMSGVDTIIHLAALVHANNDKPQVGLSSYRATNTASTLNLANQASEAGVRRFIFLSTIKVNGEHTQPGKVFTADILSYSTNASKPKEQVYIPTNPYALSKYEAEQGIWAIAQRTGMEVVVIRPPLVYGPNVKANFLRMIEWIYRGFPLPLGAIHNQRSLVAIDNLIDLITLCIDHPAAANQTFLVSDGEDLSTPTLLRRLGKAIGKPVRLFPIPTYFLQIIATLVGQRENAQRLLSSLQVDINKNRELLSWVPRISVDAGLKKVARHYLSSVRLLL